MKIRNVELETVCGITSSLPVTGSPEFAFLGRSNVGKSSLINTLMQRRNFARTSGDPGKTQTINYYHINDAFYLVDLPGYGYARVSRTTREKWGRMIERYLTDSKDLRLIFLLVDSRHAPTEDDRLMLDWLLYYHLPTAILATKVDKLKPSVREAQLRDLREELQFPSDGIFLPFSSVTKEGREETLDLIGSLINNL
ncbi:MAG: YihA family ribosome biogenesis GTP-binding protein [Lachnospiraceae bacterium]|nr:YihA family ribosome biogenesis GTP-binding protein [Lachnospiraceae bacterium]